MGGDRRRLRVLADGRVLDGEERAGLLVQDFGDATEPRTTGPEMRYAGEHVDPPASIRSHRIRPSVAVLSDGVLLADPPDLLRGPLPRPIWVHKPVATQLG
jgi:hypothetical protein